MSKENPRNKPAATSAPQHSRPGTPSHAGPNAGKAGKPGDEVKDGCGCNGLSPSRASTEDGVKRRTGPTRESTDVDPRLTNQSETDEDTDARERVDPTAKAQETKDEFDLGAQDEDRDARNPIVISPGGNTQRTPGLSPA